MYSILVKNESNRVYTIVRITTGPMVLIDTFENVPRLVESQK